MSAEHITHIVAVAFILLHLSPGVEAGMLFVNQSFSWFSVFVGFNLFRSGFTQSCPLNNIPAGFGVKGGSC